MIIVGGISPHDFEHLMYEDLEVRTRESLLPASTLQKIGDALPGLGIVAAVLGIVITMQAIDGPVAEIGHKVGSALVGTFLGILLSYGFVQPLATSLEHRVGEELQVDHAIKAGILAIHKGFAPAIAVEFARRVVPEEVRPTFEETEQLCRDAALRRRARGRRVVQSHERRAASDHRRPAHQTRACAIMAARGRWPTPTSSPR